MPAFLFSGSLRFSAVSALALASLGFSATLRVPGDFSLIQRAVMAAEPGDRIEVAPGEYRENVRILQPLSLIGTGPGVTVIAEDRARSIIAVAPTSGLVTLAGMTLRHVPAPPPPKIDPDEVPSTLPPAGCGIDAFEGQLLVQNLLVERAAANAIHLVGISAQIEHVKLVDGGLLLERTDKSTVIDDVTVSGTSGSALYASDQAAGTIKSLRFSPKMEIPIMFEGANIEIKFVGSAKALEKKVDHREAFHSPDADETPAQTGNSSGGLDEETKLRLNEQRVHQLEQAPARRKLIVELEKTIRGQTTENEIAATLGGYFGKLLATYDPGRSEDEGVDVAVLSEIQAFGRRFGLKTLMAHLETWPKDPDMSVGGAYYSLVLPRDYSAQLDAAGTQAWTTEHAGELDRLLTSWKGDAKPSPAAAATAFVSMLEKLDRLVKENAGATEDAKKDLHDRALEEIPDFVSASGYSALSLVLRQLGTKPIELMPIQDLQGSLTEEQQQGLRRALRGK